MTNRKLYGIYHYSAFHHAAVIYRLVCLSSINAELYERFFDRMVDITRKTWSKQAEDLVPNAFLHIQGDYTTELNTVTIREREISKLSSGQGSVDKDAKSVAVSFRNNQRFSAAKTRSVKTQWCGMLTTSAHINSRMNCK